MTLHAFRHNRVDISESHKELGHAHGVSLEELGEFVEDGILVCDDDQTWYPVYKGLPVLLPYETPVTKEFLEEYADSVRNVAPDHKPPAETPTQGEYFVLKSFSKEWQDYDYDGVIWELNYDDHRRRLNIELGGLDANTCAAAPFLEVGCGLGITTSHAQDLLKQDAFGVDLSLASMSATQHFKSNPFLHFVQASAYNLPFEKASFGTIYTRGVLHHTHSTERAFQNVAQFCSGDGTTYLWVYGPKSIESSLLRRILYRMEDVVRPRLSKRPNALSSRIFLSLAAVPYVAFNRMRRLGNSEIQKLTFKRAVHAARDRFTPEFAYRHSPEEVISWFNDAGFQDIYQIDWRDVPPADHGDYSRNVGVLGRGRA